MGRCVHHKLNGRQLLSGGSVVSRKKEAWMNIAMKMVFKGRYSFASRSLGIPIHQGERVVVAIQTPRARPNHWPSSLDTFLRKNDESNIGQTCEFLETMGAALKSTKQKLCIGQRQLSHLRITATYFDLPISEAGRVGPPKVAHRYGEGDAEERVNGSHGEAEGVCLGTHGNGNDFDET